MLKKIILFTLISIFLFSCASTDQPKMTGTGKPRFSSLVLEEVSYFLSSENGYYQQGKPLKLILKMKNLSQTKKSYTAAKNKFLILVVNNDYGTHLKTSELEADKYLGRSGFELVPGEERTFEIIVDTADGFYAEKNALFCQLRLVFLPKQFRRNALSIYIEKK